MSSSPDPKAEQPQSVRILTNFPRLTGAVSPTNKYNLEIVEIAPTDSWVGALRVFRAARHFDAVLVNVADSTVLRLCALRWLWPFTKWKLLSVDIHLSAPTSPLHQLVALAKRLLLIRVSHFLLYFKDLSGYSRYYGIDASRATYVPFKVNSWKRLPPQDEVTSDGEYVLTAGRTKRDLATFVEAMSRLDLPGVLLHQSKEIMKTCGTTLPSKLPKNVTAIEHDGNLDTWVDHLRRAKVFVAPVLPTTISPSGISTYLDAMAMNKVCVLTKGPATHQILTDQAVLVPPSDPIALAIAIRNAWEDTQLRAQVSAEARAYAEKLRGEDRFYQDILRQTLRFLQA